MSNNIYKKNPSFIYQYNKLIKVYNFNKNLSNETLNHNIINNPNSSIFSTNNEIINLIDVFYR
jgi:hypothetical protein